MNIKTLITFVSLLSVFIIPVTAFAEITYTRTPSDSGAHESLQYIVSITDPTVDCPNWDNYPVMMTKWGVFAFSSSNNSWVATGNLVDKANTIGQVVTITDPMGIAGADDVTFTRIMMVNEATFPTDYFNNGGDDMFPDYVTCNGSYLEGDGSNTIFSLDTVLPYTYSRTPSQYSIETNTGTSQVDFSLAVETMADLGLPQDNTVGEWGIQVVDIDTTTYYNSSCVEYNFAGGVSLGNSIQSLDLPISEYGFVGVVGYPTGECGNNSLVNYGIDLEFPDPNTAFEVVAGGGATTTPTTTPSSQIPQEVVDTIVLGGGIMLFYASMMFFTLIFAFIILKL